MILAQGRDAGIAPWEFLLRLINATVLAVLLAGLFSLLFIMLMIFLTSRLYGSKRPDPIRRSRTRDRVITVLVALLIFIALLYWPRIETIPAGFISWWVLSVLALGFSVAQAMLTFSRSRLRRPNVLARRWLGKNYLQISHGLILVRINQVAIPCIFAVALFLASNIAAESVVGINGPGPRPPPTANDVVLVLFVVAEALLFWLALKFQRWMRPERYFVYVGIRMLEPGSGAMRKSKPGSALIPARSWRRPSVKNGHSAALALERYAKRAATRMPCRTRESFLGCVLQVAEEMRTESYSIGDSQGVRSRLVKLFVAGVAVTTTANLVEVAERMQEHVGIAPSRPVVAGRTRRLLEAVGFTVQNGWPAIKIAFWVAVVVFLVSTGQLERVVGIIAGQLTP